MRILFITPPPYLPNRLHRNRSFDLIRILAKKHEVHLLSIVAQKETPKEFDQIIKVCKSVKVIYINPLVAIFNCLRFPFLPYEIAYCYSKKTKQEIQKIIKSHKIDLVYLKRLRSAIYLLQSKTLLEKCHSELVEESFSTELVDRDPSTQPVPSVVEGVGMTTKVVVDTTDAMSMFYFRMYKSHSFPKNLFYLLQAVLYKRFEKKTIEKIRNWIVCSESDQKYLQKLGADVNIYVVSNPVDTGYFSPRRSSFFTPKESRSLPRHLRGVASFSPSRWPKDSSKVERRDEQGSSLLFRGLMDKPVNIDACLFFIKEIMPLVKKKIENVKLYIVGPKPPSVIKKCNDGKSIFVTGFVKDIRKCIKDTDLSICPVRIASGTRFKITQAWAMGRPVVSTSNGAEGLLYEKDKNIAIADNPKEFAKQIVSLLKNKKLYDTLAKNGRETIVREYSFRVIGQRLERVIQNFTLHKRHSGNQASPEHPESPNVIRDAG